GTPGRRPLRRGAGGRADRAARAGPPDRRDRPHREGQGHPVRGGPAAQPLRQARRAPTRPGPGRAAEGGRVMSASSREVYRDTVLELLPGDERLVCLDSDTGLFDATRFPERYVNLGIAEHTLMGAAAGLAKSGRMPLVNTMAAFASSRANEAVKIDIAL